MYFVNKLVRILFSILFIVFFLGGCVSNEYVPFKPVYLRGEQLIVSEAPFSEEFRSNIKIVFEFHDVPFKEDEDGRILIPKKIWQDQDTMWNYTTRANDSTWIDQVKSFYESR